MDIEIINWLLEDNNPAIKYRTQTELLGQEADVNKAKDWIFSKLPENWFDTKGLWYIYYINSLSECGLSQYDVPAKYLSRALDDIENHFEYGCADFMLLQALVKLGFHEHKAVKKVIEDFPKNSLPDGGFLCQRRLKSFKYTPKSCYKANIYALLFLSACHKKNIDISFGHSLLNYFLSRNIFYKSSDNTDIIMHGKGYSITDTFHPFEPMRIGIHSVVETFSALGYGNDERLKQAWLFLYNHKNEDGKMILTQTLTKSYLPKEKVGKESKWITFYASLAEKNRTL